MGWAITRVGVGVGEWGRNFVFRRRFTIPGMVVARLARAPPPAVSAPQTMSEMYGSRAAVADLCQRELTNQRMHRYPVPQPAPFCDPDAYTSTASRSFGAPSQPGRGTPCFTVALQNDICTKTVSKRISIAELKSQKAPMQQVRSRGGPAAWRRRRARMRRPCATSTAGAN
jgi:hypothetical protein